MRGVEGAREIDETHLPALEARLIDEGDIVVGASIHIGGIAVIFVGDVEGAGVTAHMGHEGHMPLGSIGPDAVSAREDRDRA